MSTHTKPRHARTNTFPAGTVGRKGQETVARQCAAWYTARVVKTFVTLMFALFLGQAIGAWSLIGEGGCKEQCPTEQRGQTCLPGCSDCACCGIARVLVVRGATPGAAAPAIGFVSTGCENAPQSPDPQDIFHIPKTPLV